MTFNVLVMPFEERMANMISIFNEAICFTCGYLLLPHQDREMDPLNLYEFGKVFVCIIVACGIVNILIILFVQIMWLKLIIKRF